MVVEEDQAPDGGVDAAGPGTVGAVQHGLRPPAGPTPATVSSRGEDLAVEAGALTGPIPFAARGVSVVGR
ncbi:hypothetical protein [Streptomyces sp. NPDC019507]|uniref:hypothetical protein n=1 Tax=Streptomyces sp. NPDC019507 TaxID=3154689 RepID=UPI0033C27F5F